MARVRFRARGADRAAGVARPLRAVPRRSRLAAAIRGAARALCGHVGGLGTALRAADRMAQEIRPGAVGSPRETDRRSRSPRARGASRKTSDGRRRSAPPGRDSRRASLEVLRVCQLKKKFNAAAISDIKTLHQCPPVRISCLRTATAAMGRMIAPSACRRTRRGRTHEVAIPSTRSHYPSCVAPVDRWNRRGTRCVTSPMSEKSRARHWRTRATELRAIADAMRAEPARKTLLELADDLDRMAERLEKG